MQEAIDMKPILIALVSSVIVGIMPSLESWAHSTVHSQPFMGPLRVHPSNPRYFTDDRGEAIYLTGSHTWNNFKDDGKTDPPASFDYAGYLDFLQARKHNFIRIWTLELSKYTYSGTFRYTDPFPWLRTGPGDALDGKPKFDLDQFDPVYFDRLRSRVIAAGDRGIYVSIMLFEGHSLQRSNPPWRWAGHPFNSHNNINRIDGDPNGDGYGLETHTLEVAAITTLQEAYIRQVIDTVNDLDNVLYEISNESHGSSIEWQYHMIDHIKSYEASKAKQHPVGMTVLLEGGSNAALFNSSADWISPRDTDSEPYKSAPPPADGSKIIIIDTDHLWGAQADDHTWVWKSFLRGLNPVYMDPYSDPDEPPPSESVRRNMGDTLAFANRINLVAMPPRGDLASTGYCLANAVAEGAEYLVYLPLGGTVTVDLSASPEVLTVEWFNPSTGVTTDGGTVSGGADRSFIAPFSGDAVLYIRDDPKLRGRLSDQAICLDWTVSDTPPVTSSWQSDYASETGTVLLPPINIPHQHGPELHAHRLDQLCLVHRHPQRDGQCHADHVLHSTRDAHRYLHIPTVSGSSQACWYVTIQ
jgi:hypothetical protein